MATGTIILDVGAARLGDGTTNNVPAGIVNIKSTYASGANNPNYFLLGAFFDHTAEESIAWSFRMPSDYASSPVLKIQWIAEAITGAVVWVAKVAAVTPGDADTPLEHALGADNSVTTNVNTTENFRLNESSITLTNADSLAAGDMVTILLLRDAGAAGDTMSTKDAIVLTASLEYTTT